MEESRNLDVALKLARAGFAVFPCHGAGEKAKAPCAVGSWTKEATTHEATIRYWWHKYPHAAAGIHLAKSGHIVIDCDRKGELDGVEAFGDLCNKHGFDFSKVPVVGTPSGGSHFYFKQRAGEERGNSRGGLPRGIDVRGRNGYVIAPSMQVEAGEYEYQSGDLEALINAPPLPDWLAEVLDEGKVERQSPEQGAVSYVPVKIDQANGRVRAWTEKAINGELGKLREAYEGSRNNTLNEVGFALGTLVGAGVLAEGQIIGLIHKVAASIGLGRREIIETTKSGMQSGIKKPRQLPDYLFEEDEPFDEALAAQVAAWLYDSEEAKRRAREGVKLLVEQEDGTLIDEETGEIIEEEPELEAAAAAEFEYPPGLVGEIARWIVATARHPQPELAIGAALTIVGTVAGRQFAGPTFSGTHLYLLAMAGTGEGKDTPLQAVKTILERAKLTNHLGPDEFASMPAVVGFLRKKPLVVCPMDEFGGFMKRITSNKANGFEASIAKILRSMWSSSFATYMTPEAAQRESVTIYSPAMSIYGATTPEQFYGSMSGSHVEDGTLNRFLLMRGREDVEEVEPQLSARDVPQSILEGIKRIYN